MNKYYWTGYLPQPSSRKISDMENVLAVRPSNHEPSRELYFMYRNLYKTHGDKIWLDRHHLRYDITVIPPGIINGEFTKTKGHYHPADPAGHPYPEVYEVLSGSAYYLLQRRDHKYVLLIPAHKGDKVLIPPGYGHVTINPTKEELVMANLVSNDFESEYNEINSMHGAAYYYFRKEGWIPNENYEKRIPMHVVLPKPLPKLGLIEGRSLYDMIGTTDTLDVMNRPEDFIDVIGEFYGDKIIK